MVSEELLPQFPENLEQKISPRYVIINFMWVLLHENSKMLAQRLEVCTKRCPGNKL